MTQGGMLLVSAIFDGSFPAASKPIAQVNTSNYFSAVFEIYTIYTLKVFVGLGWQGPAEAS